MKRRGKSGGSEEESRSVCVYGAEYFVIPPLLSTSVLA
jgi:hypothetical protein